MRPGFHSVYIRLYFLSEEQIDHVLIGQAQNIHADNQQNHYYNQDNTQNACFFTFLLHCVLLNSAHWKRWHPESPG